MFMLMTRVAVFYVGYKTRVQQFSAARIDLYRFHRMKMLGTQCN